MKAAVFFVAVFTIAVGIVGVVSPDLLTAIRHEYFATAMALYLVAACRAAMGAVVILAASQSRAPRTLRALGCVMCLQAVTAMLAGPNRARAILEWEAAQGTAWLRAGAALALAAGGFVVFAMTSRRPSR